LDDIRTTHFGVDLSEIQFQARKWVEHNFPKTFSADNQFLGVIEEVGEFAEARLFAGEHGHDLEFGSILADMASLGVRAHKVLKAHQGIREAVGGSEKNRPDAPMDNESAMMDAVGDIVIFVISLCSAKGWSFDRILAQTWREVRKRDWIQFPKNGVTE
jgi:NTP pyrophosphatase (non-canonical NTP hydrolase)